MKFENTGQVRDPESVGDPRAGLPGSVCLAANVAWDVQRRVSAHAIFSVVNAVEFPFVFPAPFYVVIQLFDLGVGPHNIGLEAPKGIGFRVESQLLAIAPAQGDFGSVVLPVFDCVVERAGDYLLHVTVDGQKVPVVAPLRVLFTGSAEMDS